MKKIELNIIYTFLAPIMKHKRQFWALFLLSLCLLGLGVITISTQYFANPTDLHHQRGVVEKTTPIWYTNHWIRSIPLRFLHLQLQNIDLQIFVYHPTQHYDTLQKQLKPGQEIAVRYSTLQTGKIKNIVRKIMRDEEVIFIDENYQEKEYFTGILLLILALLGAWLSGAMLKKPC